MDTIKKNRSDKSSKSMSINIQLTKDDVLLMDFLANEMGKARAKALADLVEDNITNMLYSINDGACIMGLACGVDELITDHGYEHQYKDNHSWYVEALLRGVPIDALYNPADTELWEMMYTRLTKSGEKK